MAYVGPAPANSIIATSDIEDGAVTSAKLGGNIVTPGTLDVNGQEFILDADADSSITADTDDKIDVKIGGTDAMTLDEATRVGAYTLRLQGAGATGKGGVFDAEYNDSYGIKMGVESHISNNNNTGGIIDAYGANTLTLKTNSNNAMVIAADGAITKPLQPCVMVNPAGVQSNLAVSTTVDVIWGTERFDQNADFASNTFTAPVTGRYQVNVELRLDNLDTAANFLALYALSSNHNYASSILDYSVMGADVERWTQSFSGIIDMDASDTFKVQVYIDGGSAQTDVQTNSYLSIGLFA